MQEVMSSIQVPPQLWMMMTRARSHSHAASAIIAAGLDWTGVKASLRHSLSLLRC